MKNVFDILDELDNRYENKDWSINEAIELAIEETSKAKDEEFIKILYKYFEDDKYIDWTAEELYEGIKEDLKENKE